jgi:uncharacterized protein
MRVRFLSMLIVFLIPSFALAELPDCPPDELRILAPDGSERVRYRVNIADSPEKRERGLMFVEGMPEDEGMVFLFEKPAEVGFWMRNTLIPLDLIFIDRTGRVVKVHPDAIPHDETLIWSDSPVVGVLEVNGGQAGLHGVVPGDLAGSPYFPAMCNWPEPWFVIPGG